MAEYRHIITPTPPVLRERDGRFSIVVSHGDIELEAEVGDWFMQQFVDRVILPRLTTKKATNDDPQPSHAPHLAAD